MTIQQLLTTESIHILLVKCNYQFAFARAINRKRNENKTDSSYIFDSIYEKRCVKHWIVDDSVSRIVILIGKEWLNLFFVTINQGECTSNEEANQRLANEYSFA